jgi:cytochrome c oxidase subunit 2
MFFFYLYIFFQNSLIFSIAHCDAPESWQMNFQDPATPAAEGMLFFHNYLWFFLIIIGFTTFWVLFEALKFHDENNVSNPKRFTHSSLLEIIWTIIPAIILLFMAIPSFSLLYSLDEIVDPFITLKVIGSQWFWTYEYSYYETALEETVDSLCFDSYMIPENDLSKGCLRLLEVDNRAFLPINTHIRILVTATDVLHSWAVPSFGIKTDACPGRLSEASLFIKRPGNYFGQCSEICGTNHGFMPIGIRGVTLENFEKLLVSMNS